MSYFVISLKKALNYRWHILFSIISTLLMTVAIIFLWKYIYRNQSEMQEYMIMYAILANLISMLYYGQYGYHIADKVYKGTFVVDLLRPIHFLKLNFIESVGEIAANLLIKGLPVAVILFAVYRHLMERISLVNVLLGAAALLFAFLFYMMLYMTLGLLSFWFYEIWPFTRLMNDTIRLLSGSFIPIALFPAGLSGVIKVLPFRYLYSFPIELILNGTKSNHIGWNFVILIVWDMITAVVMLAVYRRALFRCVVQGG